MQLSATLVKGKARIKFDAPKVYNFEKKNIYVSQNFLNSFVFKEINTTITEYVFNN